MKKKPITLSPQQVKFYHSLIYGAMKNLENGRIIDAHQQVREVWQHFYAMVKK